MWRFRCFSFAQAARREDRSAFLCGAASCFFWAIDFGQGKEDDENGIPAMDDTQIFQHLFVIASRTKDPRGAVSACLVKDGNIILSASSSDDGTLHAEEVLLEMAKTEHMEVTPLITLFCTLEPCTVRSVPGMIDCVTVIIQSGIQKVIFGARDPAHSGATRQRLMDAGISIRQISDPAVIKRCAEIFNSTVAGEHMATTKLKPFD